MDDEFAATLFSLHAVAEHILAAARHAETGHIGLSVVPGGFSTGPFGTGPTAVSVVDGLLSVRRGSDEQQAELTTLRDAADLVGIEPGAPSDVYKPATPCDPDAALVVEPRAARRITGWFEQVSAALGQFADEVRTAEPSGQTLWPEHFDVAIRVRDVNFGGLPGDDQVPQPYAYVGPTGSAGPQDPFFDQPFGAALTESAGPDVADLVGFFRTGWQLSGAAE